MPSTPTANTAEQIVEEVGGPDNIIGLTHCATRLRFELKDASLVDQAAIEKIPGVMGAVPQSGDRFQVVIGGGVSGLNAAQIAVGMGADVTVLDLNIDRLRQIEPGQLTGADGANLMKSTVASVVKREAQSIRVREVLLERMVVR